MKWFTRVTPTNYSNGVLIAVGMSTLAFGAGAGAGMISGQYGFVWLIGCGGSLFAWMATMENIAQERKAYWMRMTGEPAPAAPEPEVEDEQAAAMPADFHYDPTLNTYVKAAKVGKKKRKNNGRFDTMMQPITTLPVNEATDGGEVVAWVDVNYALWKMAQEINLYSVDLTEKFWMKKSIFKSINEFRAVREYMMAQRIAKWNNPYSHNQGCDLTKVGRVCMERLQKDKKPPTSKKIQVMA